MDSFVNYLANQLYKNHYINSRELDEYRYGIELFLSKIAHFTGIFITSFLIKGFYGVLTGILFSLFFINLREHSGGYHSSTRIKCFFISILMTFMLLLYIMDQNYIVLFNISIFCSIYIGAFSPIIHENNPLSTIEIKKQKKCCLILLFIYLLANILLTHFKIIYLSRIISSSIILDFALFFLGQIFLP